MRPWSAHEELAIRQDAGIPPADVLRSATVVPAQFVGLGDRLGSLVEGKTASMVLLRANPLDDVRNAREIEAVFLRGRYFDREDLDRLLSEARELAESSAREPSCRIGRGQGLPPGVSARVGSAGLGMTHQE